MLRMTWPMRALFAVSIGVMGCGSPVVDPGRTPRPIGPIPSQIPAPSQPSENDGLPRLQPIEIQQVPAESLITLPNDSTTATYHNVQPGETLASVSKKYGVSADKLRSANGLDASASLKAKQLLFIPRDR